MHVFPLILFKKYSPEPLHTILVALITCGMQMTLPYFLKAAKPTEIVEQSRYSQSILWSDSQQKEDKVQGHNKIPKEACQL